MATPKFRDWQPTLVGFGAEIAYILRHELMLLNISCTQDFQILFSERGHNSDMKKMGQLFFHEQYT